MSETGNRAAALRVGVYALIGQDERLLLVEHPDHDALPGGAVRAGEPVEQALRRALRDQLDATIADLDFCAVIEHDTSERGEQPSSELAFLFDITLTNPDRLNQSSPQPHRWADQHELSSLRPHTIRHELITGTLSADNPWRAWTP